MEPTSSKELFIDIKSIKVGQRIRRSMGDISALAASTEAEGLLQPVGLTEDHRLIFGERRLRAFKHLKRIKIPARIISISSILQGEFLENQLRQDFNLSERVALTIALAAEETSRQGQRTSSAIANEVTKPITRAVAKAGWGSDDNFYRAKKVVDQVDAGDAIAELRDAMDAGAVALYKAAELAALPNVRTAARRRGRLVKRR